MNRRDVGRFCCAALVATCSVSVGNAEEIASASVVLSSTGDPITFDFSANADALAAKPVLVGLEVNWIVKPGSNSNESQINAGLAIPSFEVGDRLDSALAATLPGQGDAPVAVQSTMHSSDGLSIGPAIIDEFLKDETNTINAMLYSSGVDSENLDEFFADGGTIEAQLVLQTSVPEGPDPVPGGGTVPEPMSLAIWGAAGALALYRRRKSAA
jgi:hypothetical protein